MTHNFIRTCIALIFVLAANAAQAAPTSLDDWFANATGLTQKVAVQHIATTDFMCGKTFNTTCKDHMSGEEPGMLTFWGLLKYDRAHQIGFARSSTDQEGFALFKAPPPPGVSVPNADLSNYGTGRGLHIGSTYAQVLALYGPPEKHGSHFVTAYGANDTVHFQGKPEEQPEVITLVIDNGRVSSITINVELWEP